MCMLVILQHYLRRLLFSLPGSNGVLSQKLTIYQENLAYLGRGKKDNQIEGFEPGVAQHIV